MTADELAHLTLDLCAMPSETGNERAIADWVEARCREKAGDSGVTRFGNSVICDPNPGSGADRPRVALVGHLDTVKCAQDQPLAVEHGKVYGCGASDMKAGVAVMVALLDEWRKLKTARPVWIFYDGEEGPFEGNGLNAVFASGALQGIDFAFILEPTDGAVQPGCMGTMHARIKVSGKRAHAARPWQGENALYRAAPLLARFAERPRRPVRFGELEFYEVMTVTQAHTVNSANVVPDVVTLNVNLRFAPGSTAEQAEAELRELVGDNGEIEITDSAPAGEVVTDHPLMEPWRMREGLQLQPKQAWTDLARFTSHGIPAVNFGPGETAQAHQAGEWCSVVSLDNTYHALRRFFGADQSSADG